MSGGVIEEELIQCLELREGDEMGPVACDQVEKKA